MAFQPSFSMGSSNHPDVCQATLLPDVAITSPWMQVPPSIMPWTVENRPNVVRFGEASGESWGIPRPKLKFFKRKSDLDCNPKPTKMHITEEKVAAQLKNMHISNNYSFGDSMDEQSEVMLPTLVLSKEVQSLPTFTDSLLPECLLPKLEKPTRALVLWRPPEGSVTSRLISSLRDNSDSDQEGDHANNNTSTPDLNVMATSGCTSSTGSEMEL